MRISEIVSEQLKNPLFSEAYKAEGEKLNTAISIYLARKKAGMSQEELANRANLSVETIQRMKDGEITSFEDLSNVAHVLKKELDAKLV